MRLTIYLDTNLKDRQRHLKGFFACVELLRVFRGRLGYQLEFAQRANEFGIRLFSGGPRAVDRRVVAIFGPIDGFGDVVVFAVRFGPFVVDVEFHDFSFFHRGRTNGYRPLVLLKFLGLLLFAREVQYAIPCVLVFG